MLTTSTGVATATTRNLGSLRLPSLATRVATAADGSRIAWDRVIVWSAAAQRQLRDGSTGRSLLPGYRRGGSGEGGLCPTEPQAPETGAAEGCAGFRDQR